MIAWLLVDIFTFCSSVTVQSKHIFLPLFSHFMGHSHAGGESLPFLLSCSSMCKLLSSVRKSPSPIFDKSCSNARECTGVCGMWMEDLSMKKIRGCVVRWYGDETM